jgi:hypothetical protein
MAYVNNIELSEALLESHEQGTLTTGCFNLFNDIVKQRVNLMLKHNKALHYDLMMACCIDKLTVVWIRYDFSTHDNPFAYFVSIVDNAIKRYFIDNQMDMENISLDGSTVPAESD